MATSTAADPLSWLRPIVDADPPVVLHNAATKRAEATELARRIKAIERQPGGKVGHTQAQMMELAVLGRDLATLILQP